MWTFQPEIAVPGATIRVGEFEGEGPVVSTSEATVNGLHYLISPYTGRSFGSFRSSARTQEFSTGRIVFIPAGVPLHFRGSGGHVRCINCFFEPQRFQEVTGFAADWQPAQLAASFDVRDTKITQAMSRLWDEATGSDHSRPFMLEAIALSLMVELSRYLRSFGDHGNDRGLMAWQLQRIRQHVEEEANFSSMARDLAQLCGISESQLRRGFRAATRQTVHAYVQDVRLERAKALLLEGEMPMKRVSELLGFSRLSGFSIAFRKATGETPSSFRQRLGPTSLVRHPL
jgi:AraC family transcriptional regulator